MRCFFRCSHAGRERPPKIGTTHRWCFRATIKGSRRSECVKPEMQNPNTIVWFQDRFVRLAEANVNILTHALNYGTGVFEGIRGYYEQHAQELFLVRMPEHYERWKKNCGI